jgi:hypothetical protein
MFVSYGRRLALPLPGLTSSAIDGLIDLCGPGACSIIVGASTTSWSMLIALLSALATWFESVNGTAGRQELDTDTVDSRCGYVPGL